MNDEKEKTIVFEEEPDAPDFRSKLCSLLNSFSKENNSNTPDWILRNFICNSLKAFDAATLQRDEWYGRSEEVLMDSIPADSDAIYKE